MQYYLIVILLFEQTKYPLKTMHVANTKVAGYITFLFFTLPFTGKNAKAKHGKSDESTII